MNLGHGRAGHFPDYSYARYRYMPAWGDYQEVLKDNPSDYMSAFCQMVYALKSLRREDGRFEKNQYDTKDVLPLKEEIEEILARRRTDAADDWRALGEKLSGCRVEDFDVEKYQEEYMGADEDAKDDTLLGRYIMAALAQKSMVTHSIFTSGSLLAGVSVDFEKKGFRGIRDFRRLARRRQE